MGHNAENETVNNNQHSWRESPDVLEQFQDFRQIDDSNKWCPEVWSREWVFVIPATFDKMEGIDDWSASASIRDTRNQTEADLAECEPGQGTKNSGEGR